MKKLKYHKENICADAPISCFSCPYDDCIYCGMPSKEEVQFTNGAIGVVKRNVAKEKEAKYNVKFNRF